MQLVVTVVITAVCILYYWQNKIDIVFIMGKNMYDKRMAFCHLLSQTSLTAL